jgi:hypothetical protein
MVSPEAMAQLRLGRIVMVGMGLGLLVLLGLPGDIVGSGTSLPLWLVLVLGFTVVYSTVGVLFVERLVKPLARGLDATTARSRAVAALRASITLRVVAASMPAMIGLGLAEIAQTVMTPFRVMVPVSLALLALAWPRAALVMSVRDRLEREGTPSYLVVTDVVTTD